jgi:hypothetical protein
VRILYNYLGPSTGDDPVPRVLRTQTFLAADPRTFNDPFEVRPYFDQERHDYFAAGHEGFHGSLGTQHSLIKSQSMVGFPLENVVGYGDRLNRRFRDAIGQRFRVVCLRGNRKSTIMWAHYTRIYEGAVIGIDVDDPNFATGLRDEGFSITYSHDRSITKLPLAFYQFPPVEMYDGRTGALANDPMQLVDTGGVTIFFYQYQQQLEEAYLRALSTKAEGWQYEEEVRFIYELPTHADHLRHAGNLSFLPIPRSAIREIIVGFNASIPAVEQLIALHKNGNLGEAQLFYTTCHPNLFEVQAQEADPSYLLDYFRTILPAKD